MALDVTDLAVSFQTRRGRVDAVRDVTVKLGRGETLGIVGESGSGKSVTCYAIMRILDRGGEIAAGKIVYGGADLSAVSESDMNNIRGREISMIFQNPRAALNPIRKVGHQIMDVLRQHNRAGTSNAKQRAIEAMEAVRIRDAHKRFNAYPFELSGGMCQRIVIAIALACDPRILIADEPTTGLDVTTQKIVMDLIADLIRARNMSFILITHDLALAASYCDRLLVMRNGFVVEEGPPQSLLSRPQHPYTQKLVYATPRDGTTVRDLLPSQARRPMPDMAQGNASLLEVVDLSKTFITNDGPVNAVDKVSFRIADGGSLGLVGESGSGKSTVSNMIVRLLDPSAGAIIFDGEDLTQTSAADFARNRRRSQIQMVFQDATDSLNPRFTVRQCIAQPLLRLEKIKGARLKQRIDELADLVELPQPLLDRFPHQLSGGQKARVGIARAIAVNPRLLVLDEPTAALDVSIQAVILNLLVDLRARLGMTFLFVSHDLQVIRLLCDNVIVMRAGRIEEAGRVKQIMRSPESDYTKLLLDAVPNPIAAYARTERDSEGAS